MASFLKDRLQTLRDQGRYRELAGTVSGVDFWSNDYLGLARAKAEEDELARTLTAVRPSPGSRSISGDNAAYHDLEARIAAYHGYPAALVFNSGYTANLGLLSALLRRTDTVIYDELIHACCRDGIRLGHARARRFAHNDLEGLRRQLAQGRPDGQIFVLTEGRFSMDGDLAPLAEMAAVCREYAAHLIVDEAHSGGVEGTGGAGCVAALGLQREVFATVITYGKAFGAHGAAVLGSGDLRKYLINVCRPFIYTTSPAPAQWRGIAAAYRQLAQRHAERHAHLQNNIHHFRTAMHKREIDRSLAPVTGPIQILRLPGNAAVLAAETACREAGLLVKGIRSPTVAAGQERLRICLHAFNTQEEIDDLTGVLHRVLLG